MPTVIGYHDVKDQKHWLTSPMRKKFFGPLGITTIRTFIDPQNPKRVAVMMDVPDMDALQAAMQTPGAAEAMAHDGVVPESLVILVLLVVFGADPLTAADLPSAFFQAVPKANPETGLLRLSETGSTLPLRDFRAQCEREYLEAILRRTGWNFAAAARLLGIQRTYLHQKVTALGLERPPRP
jgi:DNA-binding NtrC family response regulator